MRLLLEQRRVSALLPEAETAVNYICQPQAGLAAEHHSGQQFAERMLFWRVLNYDLPDHWMALAA